jgi:Arylsulfatase A and related enzymes
LRDKRTVQDKWLYLSGIEELSEEVTKQIHNAYLKRLSYLDTQVKETVSILKRKGVLEDATLIITSDHGQLFGEHNALYHAMPPYEGVSKVPLIATNYKNGKPLSYHEEIESPVSLLQLHQGIMDISNRKYSHLDGNMRAPRYVISEHTGISEGWDEHLLYLLKKKSSAAKKIYAAKMHYNKKVTAIYRGDMKLIHFFGKKKDELYNIAADRFEQDNLIEKQRETANSMLRGSRIS